MVTLKDIAERVGVSITTVSRVLNGKGSISQETKDKVFQVMRELNYYPNEMARSLVNKNSHIIGLIVPYIDHPFFSALTAAIEEASSHAGYKLFLCISGGNQERELEQFAALQANNVAGVLVCTRDSHNMDELLNRRNIPLVLSLIHISKPQRAGVPNPGDAHGAARLCGDHQPAALPRVGLGQRRGLQRGVGAHLQHPQKAGPAGCPGRDTLFAGGRVCVGGGAIGKGAALGGSFSLWGQKSARLFSRPGAP